MYIVTAQLPDLDEQCQFHAIFYLNLYHSTVIEPKYTKNIILALDQQKRGHSGASSESGSATIHHEF